MWQPMSMQWVSARTTCSRKRSVRSPSRNHSASSGWLLRKRAPRTSRSHSAGRCSGVPIRRAAMFSYRDIGEFPGEAAECPRIVARLPKARCGECHDRRRTLPHPQRRQPACRRWRSTCTAATPRCARRSRAKAGPGPRPTCRRSARVAGGEMMELGFTANENRPTLKAFDRFGHRIDEVEFHPAYHRLMAARRSRTACTRFAWRHAERAGRPRRARRAAAYLHNQADAGHLLPADDDVRVRAGAAPAAGARARRGCRASRRAAYDPRSMPARRQDRQHDRHGHDREAGRLRRAREHHARRRRAPTARTAATSSSATSGSSRRRCATRFLVLAQAEGGLTCFLLPRFAPDGARNAIRIQRLKDKLGDWSNAQQRGRVRTARWPGWSARRAAASRRSSRWSR